MIKMRVRGLDDLSARMRGLPVRMQRKVIRPALSQAADPILQEIVRNAPYDTGRLKRNVRKTFKRPERNLEAIMIGISRRAYYWKFLEFGTYKMSARPFVRPAFDSRSKDALTKFVDAARIAVSGGV